MLLFTLMPTATQPEKNRLYYGDNLQVLREYILSESVDLIYLDPPFNSRQDSPILLTKLREAMSSTPFSLKENGTSQLLPCRSIRGMGCNVLFAEKDGTRSASQITAFKDSWEWNEEAARSYEEVVEQGGRVADAMRAFRTLLGGTDMLAYVAQGTV